LAYSVSVVTLTCFVSAFYFVKKESEGPMQDRMMADYGPILNEYGLKLQHAEPIGKVMKLFTDKGTFALKVLSESKFAHLMSFYQHLTQKGYFRMIPMMRTLNGNGYVYKNGNIYYLMPWFQQMSSDRNEHYIRLFKELARLHLYSVFERPIQNENIRKYYESLLKQWEAREKFFEEYIETCERKWYMSPLELQYCTYFNEIMQAMRFSKSKLDEWYETVKNKKKERFVFIHGNVSSQHFVYDEEGRGSFISLEKSRAASPIVDLLTFFYRQLKTYPYDCSECVDWFTTYNRHFPLKEEEKLLLICFLSQPEPIFRIIKDYSGQKRNDSERNYVRKLQKAYWLNKNIEFFIMRLMENEDKQKTHT
jgi:spore coat protein YsxE